MQKQAVLVCSVCALAAILTIAITMTLLKRGKTPAAPGEQPSSEVLVPGEEDISDHYQISETSAALLPETADAGESYQKETLFLGDSNTVRLYANGLISLQQFCAKEGIGTHAALNEGIVTFKKDSSTYTIAQAVAKMKPRRVVIMLGTNDTGMSVDEFIKNYTALVQAIQESYPYTDIIVNTVPPVLLSRSRSSVSVRARLRAVSGTGPCAHTFIRPLLLWQATASDTGLPACTRMARDTGIFRFSRPFSYCARASVNSSFGSGAFSGRVPNIWGPFLPSQYPSVKPLRENACSSRLLSSAVWRRFSSSSRR